MGVLSGVLPVLHVKAVFGTGLVRQSIPAVLDVVVYRRKDGTSTARTQLAMRAAVAAGSAELQRAAPA